MEEIIPRREKPQWNRQEMPSARARTLRTRGRALFARVLLRKLQKRLAQWNRKLDQEIGRSVRCNRACVSFSIAVFFSLPFFPPGNLFFLHFPGSFSLDFFNSVIRV